MDAREVHARGARCARDAGKIVLKRLRGARGSFLARGAKKFSSGVFVRDSRAGKERNREGAKGAKADAKERNVRRRRGGTGRRKRVVVGGKNGDAIPLIACR